MQQECLESHVAECSETTRGDKGEMLEALDDQTVDILLRIFKDGLVKVSCPFLNTETGSCEAGDPIESKNKLPEFPPCVFTRSYTSKGRDIGL